MNILFVCTGNTCRSPMAAAVLNKIAVENALDVYIESAGLMAEEGAGASKNAVEAMREMDIDLSGHRARQLTSDLIVQSDVILTMTEGHKRIIEEIAPKKVYTLLEYSGGAGDVSDPYGGDLEEYRETARQIYDALTDIAEKLPIATEK